jgi:hypothetical protein
LDGWRVNKGVRECVKTVLPLCAIKGLKMAEKWENRNKSDKIVKNQKSGINYKNY